MLPSLVVVEFQVDNEFAQHSNPLCESHLSFRLSHCISDPRRGWDKTTFLVTTGACLSMREKMPSLYWETRQFRASDEPVMRSRRSMSRAKDSGSMRRRRRKEIAIDGKRGARQANETSTGRWSLK